MAADIKIMVFLHVILYGLAGRQNRSEELAASTFRAQLNYMRYGV
jgi:hypothetical protein